MEIAIVIAVIVVVGAIIYTLDRRSKQKGSLFSGTPSPTLRVLAALLGIVLGGIFFAELLFSDSVHCAFPILAFAALGYALGATGLLKTIQGRETKDADEEPE